MAGSAKDSRATVPKLAPAAGQLGEAGTSIDSVASDPLVTIVFHIRDIPSWVEPFSNYLLTRDLPPNETEARQL
jgi:hypothetical protein